MKLRFWGVRGSAAVPGESTLRVGGNTSCLEVEGLADRILFFDAGTGLREAGRELLSRSTSRPIDIHIFLTHFHWDHIQGLPFFLPLYDRNCRVTIYASEFSAPLRDSLRGLMSSPYFPVAFDAVPSQVRLVDLGAREVEIQNFRISPIEVNHPQGACAYKVEGHNQIVVYAPDREHGNESLDSALLEQCCGANAVIIDSQYTPDEYQTKQGWGHSTWLESARLARAADVASLILFHHDPSHDDAALEEIERQAREEFSETLLAREGLIIDLDTDDTRPRRLHKP